MTSLSGVKTGMFLKQVGHSPYEGDVFMGNTYLELFQYLEDYGVPFGYFFILVDIVIAVVARECCREMMTKPDGEENIKGELDSLKRTKINADTGLNERGELDYVNSLWKDSWLEKSIAPNLVAAIYMFNPYTVVSCGGMSLYSLSVLSIMLALWGSLKGFGALSAILVLAIKADVSNMLFIVPIIVQLGLNVQSVVFLVVLGYLMQGIVLDLHESFLQGEMFDRQILLSPNIGLWWYFFMEMFSQSRVFFLFLFRAMPLVFVPAIFFRFKHRPQTMAHVLWMTKLVQNAYPEFSYIGVLCMLLFLHPIALQRTPNLLAFGTVIVVTTAFLPVMRFMWLVTGAGNANYYYFQTLGLNFALASVVLGFVQVSIRRDKYEK
eukprot:CAMPEP_0203750334 /NCGR_PEP_ID=MMETSP0098-20131031/4577_1 /ASSEMBLY_ACC=CAM_ASM_000208 /TAXON_ID=96639 /ORGANISM=" , Strain NY0313808BC1" /LENGTH=378 /DNA_ID=CAMNT_0050639573 /DNA_START=71 /DNA_END=1207 /DNA_ORIENTATION=-